MPPLILTPPPQHGFLQDEIGRVGGGGGSMLACVCGYHIYRSLEACLPWKITTVCTWLLTGSFVSGEAFIFGREKSPPPPLDETLECAYKCSLLYHRKTY